LETKVLVNSLSDEQKSKLSEGSLQLFENAQVEFVEYLINSYLYDGVYFDSIEKVRKFYKNLNTNQKENVSNKETFLSAEEELVTNMINDLPSTPDSITFEDIDTINYVKESYDNFEEGQELSPDVKEKLNGLVIRRDELILEDLEGNLEKLNSLVDLSEESIHQLHLLYNELIKDGQNTIAELLKSYITERQHINTYEFPSEFNYVNEYHIKYLTDGKSVIYIPFYTQLHSSDKIKEYIEKYVGNKL
ncbi:hypothetical protein D7X33_44300, partial [Butyricicoccus sp. 1XD8-22]